MALIRRSTQGSHEFGIKKSKKEASYSLCAKTTAKTEGRGLVRVKPRPSPPFCVFGDLSPTVYTGFFACS